MRLAQYEIDSIKNNFYIIFNKVRILLLWIRASDVFQGGDINLYLGTLNRYDLYEKVYFHHLTLFYKLTELTKTLLIIGQKNKINSKLKKYSKLLGAGYIYRNYNQLIRNSKQTCYSQCGEDLIIKHLISELNIKHLFYLDIGAHHPYYISNTALLYKNGFTGINIEPDPILFKAIKKVRKKDINLNFGIGEKDDILDFYTDPIF